MKAKAFAVLIILLFCIYGCGQQQSQQKTVTQRPVDSVKDIEVGGPCDQCNLMFEGIPAAEKINWETVLADSSEPGERMEISGTVLMPDQKTPARDIILYLYHTNAKGLYQPSDTQTLGKRNGHLRGWVKTNSEGKFKLFSIRPAPYPDRGVPAHIHVLVKEPGKSVYYIDEVWFDDDKRITAEMRENTERRGGDLIIPLKKNDQNVWQGNLVITLGLNIPVYK